VASLPGMDDDAGSQSTRRNSSLRRRSWTEESGHGGSEERKVSSCAFSRCAPAAPLTLPRQTSVTGVLLTLQAQGVKVVRVLPRENSGEARATMHPPLHTHRAVSHQVVSPFASQRRRDSAS